MQSAPRKKPGNQAADSDAITFPDELSQMTTRLWLRSERRGRGGRLACRCSLSRRRCLLQKGVHQTHSKGIQKIVVRLSPVVAQRRCGLPRLLALPPESPRGPLPQRRGELCCCAKRETGCCCCYLRARCQAYRWTRGTDPWRVQRSRLCDICPQTFLSGEQGACIAGCCLGGAPRPPLSPSPAERFSRS
jgi:hypothetical protein